MATATKAGGALRQSRKNAQLGALLRQELTRSDDQALKANRIEALQFYFGEPRGDEVEGRSQVVSTDVADAVNAIAAQLLPMISTDAVVEFTPNGPQDAEGVEAESRAVNAVIMEDNGGFLELETALRDALLLRLAVVRVDVEAWTDEAEAILPSAPADDEMRAVLLEPQEAGETRELSEDGLRLTIRTERRRFGFRAVDPTLFRFRSNWTDRELENCPFTAEIVYLTRSELIKRGVPKATAFALPSTDQTEYDARARDRSSEAEFATEQTALEFVECAECFYHWDATGDGETTLHRVLLGGEDYVLEVEEVDAVPFATGVCRMLAHRILGESVFDALKENQSAKTSTLRQWIDNFALSNYGRTVLNPAETNLADVVDVVAGGFVRSTNPANVVPMPVVDVGPSASALLSYQDERRAESVGAALDLQTAPAQLANVAASAVERQYSSKEIHVEAMARNFSETLIRRAWRLMHDAMRRYSVAPIQLEHSGEWTEVDPAQWPERTKLNVRTGMSTGQRSTAASALGLSMQLQAQALMQGQSGVLASPATLHQTHADWLRLSGVEDPSRYGIDPMTPEARQAAQEAAQAAQRAQQAQMQAMQQQMEQERAKLADEAEKWRAEIQFKYDELRAKLENEREVEAAKIVGDATLALEKTAMEGLRNGADGENGGGAGGGAPGDQGDNR